ncbi:MAG: trimethylamine corrinoid protein 2 [Candidatus Brocadiia bacterium]
MKWKENWRAVKGHFTDWWNQEGLVIAIPAPLSEPREGIKPPPETDDLETAWLDPEYRLQRGLHAMASTYWGADAFPSFNTMIGPGSLGSLLGAEPVLEPSTVWYKPCIDDPDSYGTIELQVENNRWLDIHMAIVEIALENARGRFLVGMPDLIENIDTLAALRGSETLLMDLIERPDWVTEKLTEINRAFFEAFDLFYDQIKDEEGGNVFQAFGLWGPGKTAKVQCDFSCMISETMFNKFVVPSLTEQCEWLDYAMYHLDGTTALQHLDALLEIEPLDAIEWTPQAGVEGGGDPRWYEMYRRIKDAGKSVQPVGVNPDQIRPLLDEVGPNGLYISTHADTPDDAKRIAEMADQYR